MPLLSEDEVFGGARGSTAQQPPAAVTPSPVLSDDEVFGQGSRPAQPVQSQSPSSVMTDDEVFSSAPPPQPSSESQPWDITKGFVSGLLEQNPTLAGEALEAASYLAPEGLRETLQSGSRFMRQVSGAPAAYKLSGKKLKDIGGIDDALTWAGETFGSGLASTLPSIVTGLVGAGVGGAIAGPPGATVGALAGAGSSSLGFNYGEVYKALKEAGMPPEQAASLALGGAVPMAALDVVSVGPIISRLGGLSELKKQTARNIAQRIMAEGGKGASREGITEAAQEAVKQATLTVGTDKPFWSQDNTLDIVEAGLGGALTGGVLGGASGVVRDKVAATPSAPASPEAVARVYQESVGGSPQPLGTTSPTGMQSGTFDETPAAPVFYSNVRRVAEEKLPNIVGAEQALATLRNTPGIKEEELEVLGLPQWLEGKGSIAKKDLIAEIESNAISIEDVVHSQEQGKDFSWDLQSGPFEIWTSKDAPGWEVVKDGLYVVKNPDGKIAYSAHTPEEAQGWVARETRGPSGTQYRDYTLPGGDNYREFLLTLPPRKTKSGMSVDNEDGQIVDAKTGQRPYNSPHWDEKNVIAHFRTTDRTDSEGKRGTLVEEIQSDWHQTGRSKGYLPGPPTPKAVSAVKTRSGPGQFDNVWKVTFDDNSIVEQSGAYNESDAILSATQRVEHRPNPRVPDAPFKTSWTELAVKRILRDAADRGMERVYFATGKMQGERYGLSTDQQSGQNEFYDKILPKVVEKWARKLGGKTGRAEIFSDKGPAFNDLYGTSSQPRSVFYVDITPAMASNVQRGLPMFSKTFEPGEADVGGVVTNLVPSLKQSAEVVNQIAKRMNLDVPIAVQNNAQMPALGMATPSPFSNGKMGYVILVNTRLHATPEEVYATVAHEFGHIIKHEKFNKADTKTKLAIKSAYEKFRSSSVYFEGLDDMVAARDNFVLQLYNTRRIPDYMRNYPLSQMSPERRQYWLGFEEWFAEQTAMWMTTDRKPLSVVDRFFSALGKQLRRMYQVFQQKTGLRMEADVEVVQFLNRMMDNPNASLANVLWELERVTKEKAGSALRAAGYEYFPPEEQTQSTTLPRDLMSSLTIPDDVAQQGRATAAMADRFNRFYTYMLSMVQVAARNPHIAQLQRYRELWQVKQLERANIMNQALETLKAWRKLGSEQSDNLAGLIDDYMNLKFLPDDEKVAGVSRRPTQVEFEKLVRDNKVNDQGLAIFQRVVADFDSMLARYKEILTIEAMKISDPVAQARRLYDIDQHIATMAKQPYFPAMRFGNLTLTIRDAAKKVIHFETFENVKARRAAAKDLQAQLTNGETIQFGVLPEDAAPMMGLPPGILDRMAATLNLSPSQKQALELLRFELAPAQSFKHRFQRKNRVEGYSKDFVRAYANYFFHGSNYYTNVKYIQPLRDQISEVRQSAREMFDGTKRGEIANFLSDHLDYTMDPKPDFATLRSMMFHWALGFSPAAAALNLSQTLVGSFPFLASKFGDLKAIAALGKAGKQLSTYYRRGTLEGLSDRDMRALSEGVKEGVLTEAMAPELAAASEGRNLGKGFGGTAAEAALQKFSEASAWMFEMSEQWNRRVTFRAAWQLASDNPNAAFVREAIEKHKLQYERLRGQGWTERDSAAFVVAKDAVEATQFIYQQYAQPRFMRGKLRTVFIFKTFVQNTLFMLWNYPSAAARSILIMAFLGGMMGVPGAEDLRGMLKAVAYRLFGKSFDLEDEARKFAVDVLGGKIKPDLLLHGISRYGMGIPWMADMVGVPLPYLDRSKAIGLGHILPIDMGTLFGPERDQARAIADNTQRASGAAFGVGFNMYKALTDGALEWNDFKRWEKALPRTLASISKSWRAYDEGHERNRLGNSVVRFDVNDPRELMEVLAMAMGYQPLRLSATWDRIIAEREAVMFWDLRRQGLMRQAYQAARSGDREQVKSVQEAIRKFNADLPQEARGKAITADALRQSFQTRARNQNLQEGGLSPQRSNNPIIREIQRLHPEAEVDVRKVR